MKRRTLVSAMSRLAMAAAFPAVAGLTQKAFAAVTDSPYAVDDAALFALLDYAANPALAPVEACVKGGDINGAKKAFAAYLRARKSVPWSLSPEVTGRSTIQWNPKAADAAKQGIVTVVTIKHTFPEAHIDWAYNATGGTTGLPNNNEWTWQLNRMEWWRDLIAAYRATGDESWAQLWAAQLRTWIEQCPVPQQVANGTGSAWRTIECGIRGSGILSDSYQAFLLSPSVSDDDLLGLVKVLVEHGVYLSACHTGGNWLTMEMNGLYSVGCLFPELKTAKAWRKQGADALYHEQTVQFLPDGAQFELTPGYHNVALDNVLGIYKRAVTVGRLDELPPGYAAGMEHAFDYNLYMLTPDRGLPKFNDSWSYSMVRKFAEAASLFPKRADFAWIGSDGKTGSEPPEKSYLFSWAGYCVMRDSWSRQACLGILDAGPLGNGHFHQDKLNFVAWPYGRELLFDSGGGSYESSRYRAYATDTFGHNCLLVDNKAQRRDAKLLTDRVSQKPLDVHWESTPDHDFCRGVYDEGWGKPEDRIATQTRSVLFVKGTAQNPPFWVVADHLAPADTAEHTYQARWNLLTTTTAADGDPKSLMHRTMDSGKPNLVVVPLLVEGLEARAVSGETQPEILGWDIRKDTDPQYVKASTVVHTIKGAGVQRFLTVFVPLKPGEENPIVSVAPGGKITLKDGAVWNVTGGDASGPLEVLLQPAGGGSPRRITGGKAA